MSVLYAQDGRPVGFRTAGQTDTFFATLNASGTALVLPDGTEKPIGGGGSGGVPDDLSVTNAKFASVPTGTVKGRTDGGPGAPDDIPMALLPLSTAASSADAAVANAASLALSNHNSTGTAHGISSFSSGVLGSLNDGAFRSAIGAGTGSGDVAGPAGVPAGDTVVLFDSTTGKLVKAAAATGLALLTAGQLSAAIAEVHYAASNRINAVVNTSTNNQTVIQAAVDAVHAAGGGPVRFPLSGSQKTMSGPINWKGSVDVFSFDRSLAQLQSVANATTLWPSADGVFTNAALDGALITIPAIPNGTTETDSFRTRFSGIALLGNPSQATTQHGIYAAAVSTDPSPGGGGNKPYAGVVLEGVEVRGFNGDGIRIDAGRARNYIHDTRALNNAGYGLNMKANDFAGGMRTGWGGNGRTQVFFSGGSAPLFFGWNAWKTAPSRSLDCISVENRNNTGWITALGVSNDHVRARAIGADNRIHIGGAHFGILCHPHEDANFFLSDGVCVDNGYPTSLDTDPTLQAYFSYINCANVFNFGNVYMRSSPVAFSTNDTPNDGSTGTAHQYLTALALASEVGWFNCVSSEPGVRPWVTTQPVPFLCNDTSTITYGWIDPYRGMIRFGTKGTKDPRILLGVAASQDVNTFYIVDVGQTGKFNRMQGVTEFESNPRYASAWAEHNLSAGALTILPTTRFQSINSGGTAYATRTINLPANVNLTKDQELTIFFRQAAGGIDAITWGGTINAASAARLPTKISGPAVLRLWWSATAAEWSLQEFIGEYDRERPLTTSAWQALTPQDGMRVRITDLGPFPGVSLIYSATSGHWHPVGEQTIFLSTTPVTGTTSASEQAIRSVTLPAGITFGGLLDVEAQFSKSGTTDAYANLRLRIDNAAGITGNAHYTDATGIAAASVTRSMNVRLRSSDSTHFVREGTPGSNAPFTVASSTTATQGSVVTANQTSVALVFNFCGTGGGTTDTPRVDYVRIRLLPSN